MATLRQWKKKLIKETTTKEVIPDFFPIKVFGKVPKPLRITQEDEGKRLWLAEEYRTKKIILRSIEKDHYEITYVGEKKYRTIYPEEAVLHPDELTEDRLKEHGYEIKDGRKK